MKKEMIRLDLLHYVDSDYECKDSYTIIEMEYNGEKIKKQVTGFNAESLFRLCKDLIDSSIKEEEKKNG